MASGTGSTRQTVPTCGQPSDRRHGGFGSTVRALAASCVISSDVRNMSVTVAGVDDVGNPAGAWGKKASGTNQGAGDPTKPKFSG